MNKIATIIITLGLVVAIGIIFVGGRKNSESVQNIEIRDGVQYITINAKGGYYPRESTAKAGIPTKLIVKTDDTYDCSSALVVRSVGFQEILPKTGKTEIDLGIPKTGVPIEGICGMGMYSFNVNFQN
jgi:plastocyanin domain-containing protein